MHLRCLGNLCSSAVYNQGQLTLIFNTISCGLQSKVANNRVTVRRQAYSRLLDKPNENVANQRKHKLYKRWRHEIRHKGPPVKISPGPLRFNPELYTTTHLHPNALLKDNIYI